MIDMNFVCVLVAAVVAAVVSSTVNPLESSWRRISFLVAPPADFAGSSSATSVAVRSDPSWECLFRWSHSLSEAAEYTARNNRRRELTETDVLLKPYEGRCADLKMEFFVYEFCYGVNVSQRILDPVEKGPHYWIIGRYDGPSLHHCASKPCRVQAYRNGALCVGVSGREDFPREASVRFQCGPKFSLAAVSESVACTYDFVVEAPELCTQSDQLSILESGWSWFVRSENRWSLEAAATLDGFMTCRAFSEDAEADVSSPAFSWASLVLRIPLPRVSIDSLAEHCVFEMRSPFRVPLKHNVSVVPLISSQGDAVVEVMLSPGLLHSYVGKMSISCLKSIFYESE